MAIRINNPTLQHFDKATGAPLAGGQMFFFEPGGGTTPKNTFSDPEGDTPNSNPVILDGDGFEPNIFGDGSYRVVLRAPPPFPAAVGVQQWARDNVNLVVEAGAFSTWAPSVSYNANDIVEASDNNFYVSISGTDNLNKDPLTSPTFWTQFDLLVRWNPNENYQTNDVVRSAEGKIYTAVQASSGAGANPDNDLTGTNWKMFDNIRIDGNTISVTNTNGDLNLNSNGTGSVNVNGVPVGAGLTQQVFTVAGAGTWTKPADVRTIVVEVVGGGGAGGGSIGTAPLNQGGGGGGAGAYLRDIIDVSAIANATFVVGVGGIGVTNADGNPGISSTFNINSILAQGGFSGQSATNRAGGGTGGIATGGTVTAVRSTGGDGGGGALGIDPQNPLLPLSGNGGASYFGSGGRGDFDDTNGQPGRAFGSGGSGSGSISVAARSGANGATGIIIVTEHR